MKTAMIRWTVVGAAVLSTAALAQPKTLKDVVDLTAKQNIDQRLSAEAHARAVAEYDQAWMNLFPSLTAQGSYTRNQYEVGLDLTSSTNALLQMSSQLFVMRPGVPGVPTIPSQSLIITPHNQFDGVARVDLPLVDTGRWMRLAAAGDTRDAAGHREAATLNGVLRQVMSSWYGYAAALAVRDSAKRSAQVAEEQAKLTEIREGAGVATGLDTLRSKAEVQRTRQVVADSETLVQVTRRTLTTLVGSAPPDTVPLPETDLKPEKSFEELEPNIETLPVVRAADADAAAAGKLVTASDLAFVPLVTANFTERVTNATGFSGKAGSWTTGVGFVWRIDVPTFQQRKVTRIVQESALLVAERTRITSKDTLFNDWKRLDAARFKVEAAEAQVEAARRASQIAKDRFAAGAGTQFDVMQAERDLFGAEVGQIQAKTELASYRALLRLSANLPLFDGT